MITWINGAAFTFIAFHNSENGGFHHPGQSDQPGTDNTNTDYGARVSDFEIEELARVFLPEIHKFYESEEGQRLLEEWKEKKQ